VGLLEGSPPTGLLRSAPLLAWQGGPVGGVQGEPFFKGEGWLVEAGESRL
jgi:hypothetical protein